MSILNTPSTIVKMQILHYEGIALHLALTELATITDWFGGLASEKMLTVLFHLLAYRTHLEELAQQIQQADEEKHLSRLRNELQEAFGHHAVDKRGFITSFFQCMDGFQACLNWSQSWRLYEKNVGIGSSLVS